MVNLKCLSKHWVHSFEEDTPDCKVYRPESFGFPMARGRVGMELKNDGSLIGLGIGRNDVPSQEAGNWHVEDGRLLINYPDQTAEQDFLIKEASDDKLVLEMSRESK